MMLLLARTLPSLALVFCAFGLAGSPGFALAAEQPTTTDNPYLAAPKLSRPGLAKFIKRMQGKPESLRKRPGFNAAVLDAADRILSSDDQDELATEALATKLATLHYLADQGDPKADQQLTEVAAAHRQDERPAIAELVRFYLLERQALDADTIEAADLAALLAELKKYCEQQPLEARHLRLASATVRIINRLPDEQAAAAAYREFGGWFAKSENPELARYGRKIQSGPERAGKGENPLPAAVPAVEPSGQRDEP